MSREVLVLVVLQFIAYYYVFDPCYLLLCTEGGGRNTARAGKVTLVSISFCPLG